MTVPLVDIHAHLQDEAFSNDLSEVIERSRNENIVGIINAGTDLETTKAAIQLSEKIDHLWVLAGFHPHDAVRWHDNSEFEIEKMSIHKKVLGIGEIGLDYFYDNSPRDIQREVFIKQWELAGRLKLPVVVHIRDAFDDFFALTQGRTAPPRVLLHCFSGDQNIAAKALERGYHFSIGGALTYSKNETGRSVFSSLPSDVIHLETDCPYLVPVPFRGKIKRCEPHFIRKTFELLCKIRGESQQNLSSTLLNNALNFFSPKFKVSL